MASAYIPAAVPSLTLNGNKCNALRKHSHCKDLSQSHIQQKSRFRDIHLDKDMPLKGTVRHIECPASQLCRIKGWVCRRMSREGY